MFSTVALVRAGGGLTPSRIWRHRSKVGAASATSPACFGHTKAAHHVSATNLWCRYSGDSRTADHPASFVATAVGLSSAAASSSATALATVRVSRVIESE